MADLLDGDVELTEFVEMDVQSIKGVRQGANGFPVLLMKGLGEPETAAKGARDRPCGKSYDADSKAENCEECGKKLPPAPASKASDGAKDCPTCEGDGKIKGNTTDCPDCDGTGKVKAAKSVPAWYEAVKSVIGMLALMAAKPPAASAWTLIKAMAPDGSVDEKPDIDTGKQAIALIAQAIEYEAQELAAGNLGEIGDIFLLADAGQCLRSWLSGEIAVASGETIPGLVMNSVIEGEFEYPAGDLAKASRKFSADDRKKLADKGHALPDGSYPIPDVDALGRAATLCRSKHGNWQAAEKLIARRAKELGVANPLADDKGDTSKGAVAEGGDDVHTDHEDTGSLSKAVEDAVTKATAPLKEQIDKLGGELAKVKALPVPGGPLLTTVRAQQRGAGGEDHAAKAAYFRRMAETVTDRQSADGYRQLAREADEKAAKAAAPAGAPAS